MRVNQIPHVRLNNYQLDKRKKQWALLSATVLTALSAGLASAHAADQPTAVLTAPTTAAVPTPAVSSAGMSTRSQPAAESIAPTQLATAAEQPAAGESSTAAAQSPSNLPPQENLPTGPINTNTVYGSEIDPSKYSLSFNVSLPYKIPQYNLVDGDLRFASNEEVAHLNGWTQPALIDGQAVNTGRYLVFLSKPGYDNLLAWLNGHWEGNLHKENGLTVGDKWVPDASLHNIALAPYNLATIISSHWYAFYIINPYDVQATITGQSVINDNGSGEGRFAPGQYTVSFAGTPGAASFTNVSHGFNYHFQTGDLTIGEQNADGSYQVVLTAQGNANLRAALDQAFHSGPGTDHASNYLLAIDHAGATVVVNDLAKQTMRTIIAHNVNDTTTEQEQTVTFNRSFTTDPATGVVTYGSWHVGDDVTQLVGTWPAVTVPPAAGYQATPERIAAVTVDGATTNQRIDVYYQKIAHGGTAFGNRTPAGTAIVETARRSQSAGNAAPRAGQLPQTGADHSASAIWGLGLFALASLFGFGRRKKRPTDVD